MLLFFLGVFGQRSAPYNPTLLSLTWRLQYGLGLLPIMYMLYHRVFRLQESAMWKARTHAWLASLAWCPFARLCEFHVQLAAFGKVVWEVGHRSHKDFVWEMQSQRQQARVWTHDYG